MMEQWTSGIVTFRWPLFWPEQNGEWAWPPNYTGLCSAEDRLRRPLPAGMAVMRDYGAASSTSSSEVLP
jgi:hypothetical protein